MQRAEFLTALTREAATHGGAVTGLHDGRPYKVVRRPSGLLIATWGAPLGARSLEEIGEDAGMIDPRVTFPISIAEHPRATLIRDGYAGSLCPHRWGMFMHFKGRPSGYVSRCLTCGVRISATTTGRSVHEYDTWTLRPHVFAAWSQLGPPPGALRVQAHH